MNKKANITYRSFVWNALFYPHVVGYEVRVRFEVIDDFGVLQFVVGELGVPVIHVAADDVFVGVDFQMARTIAHGTRISLDVGLERFVQTIFKTVEHVQVFALRTQHFGEH